MIIIIITKLTLKTFLRKIVFFHAFGFEIAILQIALFFMVEVH